mmetsp:Transcript_8199/g.20862  ORF Transcript_8199/g.20862 Transcript_8199/m.20862 type:complete len:323 (-) Transcript_8199:125-1093(-)
MACNNGGLGPDAGRLSQAWGRATLARNSSRERRGQLHERERAQRHDGRRTGGPKIVVTAKKDAHYPLWKKPPPVSRPVTAPAELQVSSRAARQNERRPAPRLSSSTAKPKPRDVPAPPPAGAWGNVVPVVATQFKVFYDRGDIPVLVGHSATRKLKWKVAIQNLDYSQILPLFFEGLRETEEPYTFIAHAGVQELLLHGGDRVLPVVPQLIQPLKKALNTKNPKTIAKVLLVLQDLVRCAPYVGEAMVPYYRSILPTFNLVLLLDGRKSIGDEIDFAQRKRENLHDLINETLELLEQTGGPNAYVNIKYMIPSYESAAVYPA